MSQLLGNGNLIVSAAISTQNEVRFPFHEVRTDGSILRSFGFSAPLVRPGVNTGASMLFLLSDDRRSLWIQSGRYGAQAVWLDGLRQLDFAVVGTPWLGTAPARRLDTVVDGRAMTIAVSDGSTRLVRIDSSGLVWFSGTVPLEPITPQMVASGRRPEQSYRLEVIDPAKGRLLVSQSITALSGFFGGNDLAFSGNVNDVGITSYTVWRVHLSGQR
jgi:hypothetical protein